MLTEKFNCIACTACVSVCPAKCITMIPDTNGFLFPQLMNSGKCVECGSCKKVCPVESVIEKGNKSQVYAAYTTYSKLREDSSSGGVFSVIAFEILKHSGAVYGASYNDQFKVEHICVENQDELYKLRGAKYAQSSLNDCFTNIYKRLTNGQEVLFTGTPCQVAGLKSFLKKPYSNLFTIDFVCHGVPSPLAWEKYIQYRAEQDNNGVRPEKINLRSKSTGWSRYGYSIEYSYADGTMYSVTSGNDLYMRLFVGDYINRESCADCHFKGYQRCSDLTLGDFWGIWSIAPDMDDDKGTSLVVVHSDSGKEMLRKIADYVVLKEMTLDQASVQNPSVLYSSPAKENREEILQMCIGGEFEAVQKCLDEQSKVQQIVKSNSLVKHILQKIKNVLPQ